MRLSRLRVHLTAVEITFRKTSIANVAKTKAGQYNRRLKAQGKSPAFFLSPNPKLATTAKTMEMEQEAAAHLSSNGKIIVVPNSGYWIQLDQPQVVIDAVRKVLQSVRR